MPDTGTKATWLFALIGVALLISAGLMFYRDNQLAVRGLTATGTVIDFRQGRTYRNPTARQRDADPNNFSDYRAPVIRFTTEKNEVIQFAALLGSVPDGLKTGDSIPIAYLPEDPSGAEVKGSPRLNTGIWAFSIVGGASLLPAVFMIVVPSFGRRQAGKAAMGDRRRKR